VLRPVANPLPLGFLALAVGTLVVSGLQQLGWVAPREAQRTAALSSDQTGAIGTRHRPHGE